MFSPMSLCSIVSMPRATAATSTILGSSSCCRLNVSSRFVNVAARIPALWISSRSLRSGSPSFRPSDAMLLKLRMTERMLLKSCAMPPESCPIASIFWDCRSCCSVR